jgi:hypothetical protein
MASRAVEDAGTYKQRRWQKRILYELFTNWESCSQEGIHMVKGVSKQVIVVSSPDRKLFEQAIIILREDSPGITDEELLKEADRALRNCGPEKQRIWRYGPAWACGGALMTGLARLISVLI